MSRLSKIIQNTDPPKTKGGRLNRLIQTTDGPSYDSQFFQGNRPNQAAIDSDTQYLTGRENVNNTQVRGGLDAIKAHNQPWTHQVANGIARLPFNIVMGTVGQLASALDFEDYNNADEEVGNWLTSAMLKGQEAMREALPVLRTNPTKALDLTDSGWWYDNAGSLVESIASFAATGGILAKGITTLSRAVRAQKLASAMMGANEAKIAGNVVNTVTNAVLLNQAEAILESSDVYNEIYETNLQKFGNDEMARLKASDAAAATINFNRLNILLNITSANLFFKSPQLSRRKLDNPYAAMTIGRGALEGGQESIEEVINLLAGNYGRAVGLDKEYGINEIIADIGTPEAAEAALLGFVGGMGQTVLTTEGVNRLQKTVDPETGKPISVRDYNIKQYENIKKEAAELDEIAKRNEVGSFTSVFKATADIKKIRAAIDKAVEAGQTEKAKELKSLLLSSQALNAFERGTTEHLIRFYEKLGEGEQKADMGKDYKEKAKKAVQYIKDMEKVYNKVQQYENPNQVYYNRAQSYTAVQQYQEVKTEIGNAQSELTSVINRIADSANMNASNITDETLNKKKYEDAAEEQAITAIKNTPEYKEVQEAKQKAKVILKELERLDKEHTKLTSGIFQEQAKADREKAHKKLKELIGKLSDEVEARAAKEKKDAKKAEKIAKQEKEAKIATKQQAEKEQVVKKEAVALENAAIGDIVNITPAMSKKFAGKEGVVTKRANGKITIQDTETGHTFSVSEKLEQKPEPEVSEPIEDLSTEGGDTAPITAKDVIPDDANAEYGGAKVISTKDKGGEYFDWILEQFPLLPEYERHPVNKKNKPVTFEINDNLDIIKGLRNSEQVMDAIQAYKDKAFDDPAKRQLMIDFLPLNVVFRKQDGDKPKISGPLETYPIFGNDKAKKNFLNHTAYLRAHIVEGLAQGYSPESIIGSIQDQYKGLLQIDKTPQGKPERENAIHDLHSFNGDMSKVQLYMVDRGRNLVDVTGKVIKHGIGAKGEIYTVIPQANGDPFYLKLNVKKINKEEAEILFEMYKQRMIDAKTGINTTLSSLPQELQDKINRILGPTAEQKAMPKAQRPYLTPLELIGKKKDTTVKDITDFLIYDRSKNSKSQVRLDGAVLRFGKGFTYKDNIELEKNREAFIDFLTKQKRHHIKYRLKRNDSADSKVHVANRNYVNYLLGSKTLNTNAMVKVPTFQGRTSIYLNLDVKLDDKVIGTPHDPNRPRPSKPEPIKGKPSDIDDAVAPTSDTKLDSLEANIRAEWTEATLKFEERIEQIESRIKDGTATVAEKKGLEALRAAVKSLDGEFTTRLRLAGFNTDKVVEPASTKKARKQLDIPGTSVVIKKDEVSNWSLRVAEDGKVYNENTGSEIADEKLINKAHLKSNYVTWDKVQVEKGVYAVTSDGRIINITKGGKSNGNAISTKSSIAKKVLAKHAELMKPITKREEVIKVAKDSKMEAKIKAAVDTIVEDVFTGEFEAKVEAKENPNVVVILSDSNIEALKTKIYEHYDVERPGNISKSGKKVVPLHEVPGTPEHEVKELATAKKPRGEKVTDLKQTQQEKEIAKKPEKECGPASTPVKKTRAQERKEQRDRNKRK